MTTVELRLPDEVASEAQRTADSKGMTLNDLILSSLQEKLARDEEFSKAARYVLDKNSELYGRLS